MTEGKETPVETRRERVIRRLRREWPALAALALIALVAFGIGRCTAGPGEPPAGELASDAAETELWTCAMHLNVRQPAPGPCPICGMDLVPVADVEGAELEPNQVALSPRAAALARVRTTEVRRISASGATSRLLGRVDYDETTLQSITAWIGGRIDRLHVRVTGERVRRGQVVATLYSPDAYAAEQDLITAKRQLVRLAGASELARASASAVLESARQRLRLLGLSNADIERIEAAPAPSRSVSIRSPFAGTILERVATEGAYVETGAPLYRVADLTRLWVQLDAYESDLARLEVGQTVELDVDAMPGETFEGRVAFVDPVVDPARRVARVRVEISDPERRLRPGMFVEAIVRGRADGDGSQPLVVPASAPLFTGRRSVVYVEMPNALRPTYEARVVRLGLRVGDLYPVIAGLAAGERVVTEGAFTLDADLQIRGGASMMTLGDDSTEGPFDRAIETPDAWDAALRPAIEAYLAMHERLAADDLDGAKAAARALASAVAGFSPSEPAPAVEAWRPLARHLEMHAESAAEGASLEAVRADFELLGQRVIVLLRTLGNPTSDPLRLAFCPMAGSGGAEWIQTSETIANPYFGRAMHTCGSIRETVEAGSHLPSPVESVEPEARQRPAAGGHAH